MRPTRDIGRRCDTPCPEDTESYPGAQECIHQPLRHVCRGVTRVWAIRVTHQQPRYPETGSEACARAMLGIQSLSRRADVNRPDPAAMHRDVLGIGTHWF